MTENVVQFEIAELELQPGDCLIVKTELHLSREQVAHIEGLFKPLLPNDCKVLVLGGGLNIEVLKKSEP